MGFCYRGSFNFLYEGFLPMTVVHVTNLRLMVGWVREAKRGYKYGIDVLSLWLPNSKELLLLGKLRLYLSRPK